MSDLPLHDKFNASNADKKDSIHADKRELGRGDTAKVYAGTLKSPNQVTQEIAIKFFNAYHSGEKEFNWLRRLHNSTDNPTYNERKKSILQAFQLIIFQKRHFLVTELCNFGSLKELIQTHPNGLTDIHFGDLLTSMYHACWCLRQKRIIHGDIKPGNILTHLEPNGRMSFKLADFGCSCERLPYNEQNRHQKWDYPAGTTLYLHPRLELIKSKNIVPTFSDKTYIDMWALAGTFYHAATGKPNANNPFPQACKKINARGNGIQQDVVPAEWSPLISLPESTLMSVELRRRVEPLLVDLMANEVWCESEVEKFLQAWETQALRMGIVRPIYAHLNAASEVEPAELSSISMKEIYCCETVQAEKNRSCYRLLARQESSQLVIVYFEQVQDRLLIRQQFTQSWPSLDTPNYGDGCLPEGFLPEKYLDDPEHYRPFVCFTPNDHQGVSVFLYDDADRVIKVIRFADKERFLCDTLPLYRETNCHQTKWFCLSPPTFVRVSCEKSSDNYVIDLFAIEWLSDTAKWRMDRKHSHPAGGKVYQCKMCSCGNTFAYSYKDKAKGRPQLKIVSINLSQEYASDSDWGNDPLKFRVHSPSHKVCALLLTHLDDDHNKRFHTLYAIAPTGKIDFYNRVNSQLIPANRTTRNCDLLRSTFSLSGEQLVIWNTYKAQCSIYRVHTPEEPFTCDMLLEQAENWNQTLLICQTNWFVVFDQLSHWKM